MKINKSVLLLSSLISLAPSFAFADITARNDSDVYATASIPPGICSSLAGSKGIIAPHQSITVSQGIVNMNCSIGPCVASIFPSRNCSGKKIATITVYGNRGIVDIKNHDSKRYVVTGGGNQATLSNVGLKGWFQRLFS